ncbi:hypothetical protein DYB38_001223 [Aphanomyces astaci]|uniref:Uncharacterized protein n=1 Tax=Aphanomyces astaci TaxID=112090 RepID=A0A397D690_APHAT|nr:hypothetical protein DYB38_001223 [Aphanomyces astaci]
MDLDLELRRNLEDIHRDLTLKATLPTADAIKLSLKPSSTPHAKDLLDKLRGWTQSGSFDEDQLRLTELLPCVAEVAEKELDFATAEACVAWYLTLSSPRDQFYCRALFVRAKCLAQHARALQGHACVSQVQHAIHWILVAVKLALEPASRPHYDFLVYNATITYWHVARPLLRPGSARHVIESMQTMLDGLKAINEADKAWIVRYEITLATSYEDDNQLGKAAKVINDAVDHALALVAAAKPPSDQAAATAVTNAPAIATGTAAALATATSLFEEASLLQVHFGRHKDAECAKALNMVSKRHVMLFNLQSIKSKLTPPESVRAALVDLFAATTGVKLDAVGHDIPDDGSLEWETIVELGIVAVQCHHPDIGKTCERLVSSSKRLNASARIMADLLRCFLALEPDKPAPSPLPTTPANPPIVAGQKGAPVPAAPPHPAPTPTTTTGDQAKVVHLDARQRKAHRLARHVECVKVLERSLAAAKRVGQPHLIQDICLFAWNVALPLVESHLRKHVHRLFQSATALLEELESPLVALRAQMHFEAAKCEMECDYLAKASVHVNKALQLDYGGTPTEQPSKTGLHDGTAPGVGKTSSLPDVHVKGKAPHAPPSSSSSSPSPEEVSRPLDKHLMPLKRVLDLKSNLYGEPDAIEDQALILVEQSKEAHDKALKATLLHKAIALLEANVPVEHTPSVVLERFALWHDMAKLAWELKNAAMTRKAAARALKYPFGMDQSQSILQGELHFVLAETYVDEIKAYEKDPSVLTSDLRLGTSIVCDGTSTELEPLATIATCKKQVVAEIMLGLQRGLDTKAAWVVHNAATYLWNYHCHLFRNDHHQLDVVMPDVAAAFDTVFQALGAPEQSVNHPNDQQQQLPLVSCIAQGLTMIHRGDANRMDTVVDAVLKRSDQLPILHRKALIEIKTRVQLERGVKDAVVGDSTPMKVVSCIKALEVQVDALHATSVATESGAAATSSRSTGDDEKTLLDKAATYFQKAMQLWLPFATDMFGRNAVVEPVLESEQQKREFHAEIWVRLAKAALALHKITDAQNFCEQAVAPLQASDIPPAFLTKAIWRWYALAQVVWAQAILQLATDTEAQEKDVKHELALFAIKHLLLGAEFAVHAGTPSLVQTAARIMWNGMLGILDVNGSPNPSFRRKLTLDMHKMLDHLTAVDSTQYSFRVDFVCALLDTYEELQAWEAGLSTVEAAFVVIPSSAQRPLWRYRVIFMSKLGKSVADGFAKMKENDVLLQARVSKRIAASTTDPGAQYKALYRAVKDLTGKVEQAQFLVEIAEWFYTNQFPLQDVHDQLHGAIHTLLPVVHRDQGGMKGVAKKGGGAKKRKDGDVVPPMEWWHLDLLLRVYVMLALASRSFRERLEYVLVALAHVASMWDALANEHVNLQYRELFEAYQQQNAEHESSADDHDKAQVYDDFDEWKALNMASTSVTPGLVVPPSTAEWAAFDLQPHVPMLCGHTILAKTSLLMLHPGNVTQPTLTIHYLSKLTQLALDFHQHPHVLPCLWLAKAVVIGTATTTTSSLAALGDDLPLLPLLVDLQLAKVLCVLGYTSQSQECLKRAIDALHGANHPPPSSSSEKIATTQPPPTPVASLRHRPIVSSKYNVLHVCTEIADLFLDCGYHLQVKQLLDVASRQCAAEGDTTTLACVDVCRGKLLWIEGERTAALHHLQLAAATDGLSIQLYAKYVTLYATLLRDQGQVKVAKAALQHAIHVVSHLPKQLPRTSTQLQLDLPQPVSMDIDLVEGLAALQAAYADLLVHESRMLLATGGDWTGTWAEAGRVYSDVVSTLIQLGGTFAMVAVASRYADVLTSTLRDGGSKSESDEDVLDQARKVLLVAHGFLEHVWAATDNPRMDVDASAVNPVALATILAQVKAQLGRLELQQHLLGHEQLMVVYQVECDAKKNLIELWLEQTAPQHAKTADEMRLPPLDKALLYFNAAVTLTQLAPSPLYIASVGRCLRLQLQQNDAVWTYSTEGLRKQGIACSTPPPPSTAGVPATTTGLSQALDDCTRLIQSALDIALKQKDRPAIQECTYELMQCFGCIDPATAVKHLLWYQSCRTSAVAEGLLLEASAPTNRTALFVQRTHMLPPTSVPAQLASLYLEHESEAWRRLAVTSSIDATLSHVPPHMTLFSLQLSSDGSYLYGAVLASPTSTSTTNTCGLPLLARLELHSPRRVALRELTAKLKAWRASTVKGLLQISDAMTGEHDWFEFGNPTPASKEDMPTEDTLEDQFQQLVDEAKQLLGPFLDCFHGALKAAKATSDDATVVFVVDPALECIPFEALLVDVLDARDLSVHMLSIRLQNLKATPYKKDDLYYIADPQNDTGADSPDNPHSIYATLAALKSNAPSIKGLSGKKYVPSAGEWQAGLTGRRGGGLLFYGPNRSLAHFSPSHVAGLSASKCNLVVSMSRMENYASYRRQSKLDTHKPKRVLSLEDGWESAVLWSLCGANCVVTNQWNTSFLANHRVVTTLFGQLAKGVPVAKALKRTGDVWVMATKPPHNGTTLKGRVRFNPIVYGLPHLV